MFFARASETRRSWLPFQPMAALNARRWPFLAFATTWLVFSVACGGPPARTARPSKPLDDRRAEDVIARAIADQRVQPVRGRTIELPGGKALRVDVAVAGHLYGVSYISKNEASMMAGSLPKRNPRMADALQLVHGVGEDASARVILLYADDYRYDGDQGNDRESSSIAAERKLARDVRDFIVQAQAQKWP